MFEKLRVEAVLGPGDKQIQFSNWDKAKYADYKSKIVKKIDSLEQVKKVKNDNNKYKIVKDNLLKRFFNRIPDNTLIGNFINSKFNSKDFVLCYPFFSSHFLLPVKPGEVVWVFKYEEEEKEQTAKRENYNQEPTITKRYWLSRVHGESFSEDSNYTHHDRSFLPTILDNLEGTLKIPDYFDEAYSSNQTQNQTQNQGNKSGAYKSTFKIIKQYEEKKQIYIDYVSKIKKKPGDFVLQGSNNNAIILNGRDNNIGSVSLVSGKAKAFQKELQTKNYGENEDLKIDCFTSLSNTQDPNIIKNASEYNERFKYPDFYEENLTLENSVFKENFNEGKLSYKNDSSILTITEKSEKEDYVDLYNDSYRQEQGRIPSINFKIDDKSNNIVGFSNAKAYDRKNYQTEDFKINKEVPSILAKSNNLFFVARNVENKSAPVDGEGKRENIQPSSRIYLIKDSENYKNYSHIIMDDDGQVSIDGSRITIGTLKRNNSLKNGEGDLIQLGHSNEMEPLVKGLHLKTSLEHLIYQVQEGFTLISEAMNILSTHKHSTNYGQTLNVLEEFNLSTTARELSSGKTIQKQLEEISSNLDKILSKLVRTS